MKDETNIESKISKVLLGMIGERIVAQVIRETGAVVNESLDPFDDKKDMTADGLPIEVKTQTPFVMEDSFTFKRSQLNKIMRSHRTYFVSVPPKRELNVDELAGCVFELNPSQPFKMHKKVVNGNELLCVPRRQSALKMVHRIEDEGVLNTLQKLSISYM